MNEIEVVAYQFSAECKRVHSGLAVPLLLCEGMIDHVRIVAVVLQLVPICFRVLLCKNFSYGVCKNEVIVKIVVTFNDFHF